MKKRILHMLTLKHLEGSLTPEQEERLLRRIRKEGGNRDWIGMKKLLNMLDGLSLPEPGPSMTQGFYRMLEEYKRTEKHPAQKERTMFRIQPAWKAILGIAYSVLLVLIGGIAGQYVLPSRSASFRLESISEEIHQVKKMMTYSVLNQSSPAERIKAIHFIKGAGLEDDEVQDALLEIVQYDDNINVRLVALESMKQMPCSDRVVRDLFQILLQEGTPLIQLALVDAFIAEHPAEAIPAFEILLARKDLNFIVRERIEEGLKSI